MSELKEKVRDFPDQWISVDDRLPDSGTYKMAFYRNSFGKSRTITAMYAAKLSIEEDCGNSDFLDACDYDESKDIYYVPEGWYETIWNWDDFHYVSVHDGEVTHWMPLPDPPEADNG